MAGGYWISESRPPPTKFKWVSGLTILVIATPLLAGCATALSDVGGCPMRAAYIRVCLARAAEKLQRPLPVAAIEEMLADQKVMGDQVRACAGVEIRP